MTPGVAAAPSSDRAAGPVRPPSGPTSRSTQRRAVRATTLLLAALAVVLGLRGSLGEETVQVPRIAPGTPLATATDLLDAQGLGSRHQVRTSVDVAAGRVVSQQPSPGSELAQGGAVLLVVSSGPPASAGAAPEGTAARRQGGDGAATDDEGGRTGPRTGRGGDEGEDGR